ncbi:MAG: hypothetical protein WEC59_12645, partial [Salibacteraceae bacterium]
MNFSIIHSAKFLLFLIGLTFAIPVLGQYETLKTYQRTNTGQAEFVTGSNPSCSEHWKLDPSSTSGIFNAGTNGGVCVTLESVTLGDPNEQVISRKNFVGVEVIDDSLADESFDYTVEVTVQRWMQSQSPVTHTVSLDISYNPNSREKHNDRHEIQLSGGYDNAKITNIEILDANGAGVTGAYPRNFRVTLTMSESIYNTASTPALNPICTLVSSTNDVEVNWDDCPQPGWYEFEWVFVDEHSLDEHPASYYFKRGASRVTRDTSRYVITNHFAHEGTLYVRARSVRPAWNTSLTNIDEDVNVYSPWYNSSIVIGTANTKISDSLNWSYGATYSENGKRLEEIAYFDGRGRERQKMVKPEEFGNTIIASQSFLDYAGNKAVSVLPAPITANKLSFKSGLNRFAGQAEHPLNKFGQPGSFPPAMHSSWGSNKYYSDSNDISGNFPLMDLVPSASGYAYTYAEHDPIGRLRFQSIPGELFHVDTALSEEHFTKVIHTDADQDELDLFLGNNAGSSTNYTKRFTVDANGQNSVEYLDAKDRKVITGLFTQPENLKPIDYLPESIYLLSDLLSNPNVNTPVPSIEPGAYILENQFYLAENSSFFLNYKAAGNYLDVCEAYDTLCYKCLYEAEISIVRETGDTLFHWSVGSISIDSNTLNAMKVCSSDSIIMADSFLLNQSTFSSLPSGADHTANYGGGVEFTLNQGKYTLRKSLKLVDDEGMGIVSKDYINNALESGCLKDRYSFIDSATTNANYDCPVTYSNYTVDDGPCGDLKEEMMKDLYPNTGKYASFFSGIQSADTFSLFKAILNQPIYGENMLFNSDFELADTGFVNDFTVCSGAFSLTGVNFQRSLSETPGNCADWIDNNKIPQNETVLSIIGDPATDYDSISHDSTITHDSIHGSTFWSNYSGTGPEQDHFMIFGQQVYLEVDQAYNMTGDFWDIGLRDSVEFYPSAIRYFIDGTQVGVVYIDNDVDTFSANFNYTPNSSGTAHLMVVADLGCCTEFGSVYNTLTNYAVDNIQLREINYSCGCEGLDIPNPPVGQISTPVYPFQCLYNAFDQANIEGSGGVNPALLSINNFIAQFKYSWLDAMLPAHPEYCNLEACAVIYSDSSVAFMEKLDKYNWSQAQAEWNNFVYDTSGLGIEGLFPHDPLFNAISNPGHFLHYLYLDVKESLGQYIYFGTSHLSIDRAMMLISLPAANMVLDTAIVTADTNLLDDWLQFATDSTFDEAVLGAALWEKYSNGYEQIRNFAANNYYTRCLDCGYDSLVKNSLAAQAEKKKDELAGKSFEMFGDSNMLFNDTIDIEAFNAFIDSLSLMANNDAIDQCYAWVLGKIHEQFELEIDTNDSTWYIGGTGMTLADTTLAHALKTFCAGDSSMAAIDEVFTTLGLTPYTMQMNPYLLNVTQPYEAIYNSSQIFGTEWNGCFNMTYSGDSIDSALSTVSSLPQGIEWYNAHVTGFGLGNTASSSGLQFESITCDSLMWQRTVGSLANYTSLHFFLVKVYDAEIQDTILLRGFFKNTPLFDGAEQSGPFEVTPTGAGDRIYCKDIYDACEGLFASDIVVDYIDNPLYSVQGSTPDTLQLAYHPGFAPLVQDYFSNFFGRNYGQMNITDVMSSCKVIDSLMVSPVIASAFNLDPEVELSFHFADSVFNTIDPVCPPNSEWEHCDTCNWVHEKLMTYQYGIDSTSGMRIDSIRDYFGGLGFDTAAWIIEYPKWIDRDNWNHMYAYMKSDYYTGLHNMLNFTLSAWDTLDPVVPGGGSVTLSGYFNSDYPLGGSFPFGTFSGSEASIDSISEGTYDDADMWIRHNSNGRVWFHYAIEQADTFHDIILDYQYFNGEFTLDQIDTILFMQPLPGQGEIFDFIVGVMNLDDSTIHIMNGTATFPVAYMCDLPAVSLYEQPSNLAPAWTPDCTEGRYYDAYKQGEDDFRDYIQNKRQGFELAYLDKCRSNTAEELWRGKDLGSYYHTLYFYDRADNLIKTVPPAGVRPYVKESSGGGLIVDNDSLNKIANYRNNQSVKFYNPPHVMASQYAFNSYNEEVWYKTPDGGESHIYYDKLGRVLFSQNAKQRAAGEYYSYSLYDNLSRVYETGEFQPNDSISVLEDDESKFSIILHHGDGFENTDTLAKSIIEAAVYILLDSNQVNAVTNLTFDQLSVFYRAVGYGNWVQYIKSKTRNHAIVTRYDYQGLYGTNNYNVDRSWNLQNRVSAMYKYEKLDEGAHGNFDNAIIYKYDIAGNVSTMYREVRDMGFFISKRFDYYYDQVSGNVNEMRYQQGEPDALHHRYTYDAQNRLTQAQSSRNGIIWDVDAHYEYYAHGPLARVTLGNRALQSVEYAYTLQGWLKSVNGMNAIGNQPSSVPDDLLSFDLRYFSGDYEPLNSSAFSEVDSSTQMDLFNGNIAAIDKRLVQPQFSGMSESAKKYRYDQLNRLKSYVDYDIADTSGLEWDNINGLETRYKYDFNGNITNLTRSAFQPDMQAEEMDELEYKYTIETNQLHTVCEFIDKNRFCCDFDMIEEVQHIWKPLYSFQSEAPTVYIEGEFCSDLVDSWPFDTNGQVHCYGVHNLGEYEENDNVFFSDTACRLDTVNAQFEVAGGGEPITITLVRAVVSSSKTFEYDPIGNLIADHESGIEVQWNPVGKVSIIDKYKQDVVENSGLIAQNDTFNLDCPACEEVVTMNNPEPDESEDMSSRIDRIWDGSLSFDYDPMGERVKKHNKIATNIFASNQYTAQGNSFPASYLIANCLNAPDHYVYYMRDAQGNVIATYNLTLEIKHRYPYMVSLLRNVVGLADPQPADHWKDIALPMLTADGNLKRELMRITGHVPAEVLDSIEHNTAFDDDPTLLPLLVSSYPSLHPAGFWYFDATKAAELLRETGEYLNYAESKTIEETDQRFDDELQLLAKHQSNLQNDIDNAYNDYILCHDAQCGTYEPCLDCENMRAELNDYETCMTNGNCQPPYCGPCDAEWVTYDSLAWLLTLNERYDIAYDSMYNSLTTGAGSYDMDNYFSDSDTPLSHTYEAMQTPGICGSDAFRSYLDDHYQHIAWKDEVLPITDGDRLINTYFPQMADAWFAEAGDTLFDYSADTVEVLAAIMADSIGTRYGVKEIWSDIDDILGPGAAILCHFDTTDTGALADAFEQFKAYHPAGKYSDLQKWGDVESVLDRNDFPVAYLAYTLEPEQYYIYGSSRLGSIRHYTTSETLEGHTHHYNTAGERRYELADHLGNVQVVMSDRLAVKDDAHTADVWEVYDYYPFGMQVPERSANLEGMVE